MARPEAPGYAWQATHALTDSKSDVTDRAAPRPKIPLSAWGALLLIGLGLVLVSLFFAARIVLSFEHEEDLLAFKGARRAAAAAPNSADALPAIAALSPADIAAPWRTTAPRPAPPLAAAATAQPNQPVAGAPTAPAQPAARELELSPLADGPRPIEGVLRIPALGIEVVVYEGTDNRTLDRGAGRIEGTAPLGASDNVGVAAHRDGFFRPLKDIQIGDEIFVDLESRTLRYEVASTLIVAPEDTWVLAPAGRPTLTLVTCYPFYFVGAAPQRFIVRANISSADDESREKSGQLL